MAARLRDPTRVRPGPTSSGWSPRSVGYSRFMAAHMVPTRAGHDVLAGMLSLPASRSAAVPRTAVWDGEGCIGQWRRGKQVYTEEFQRFKGTLGMGVVVLRPADPESKGVVERHNGYLETKLSARPAASRAPKTSTTSWANG